MIKEKACRHTCFLTLLIATFAFSSALLADDLNYNLHSLSASVSQKVENDLMIVVLNTTHQAKTAQEAAVQVNDDMEWALGLLERQEEIDARTENYHTSPQYKSNRIESWQVSQQLRLETKTFEVLTDITGKLQARLNVQSISFAIQEQTRAKAENELIKQALAAYQNRAEIVAESLGAKDFAWVDSHINTNASHSPMMMRSNRAEMASSFSSTPNVEAGESRISVNINGRIQLSF